MWLNLFKMEVSDLNFKAIFLQNTLKTVFQSANLHNLFSRIFLYFFLMKFAFIIISRIIYFYCTFMAIDTNLLIFCWIYCVNILDGVQFLRQQMKQSFDLWAYKRARIISMPSDLVSFLCKGVCNFHKMRIQLIDKIDLNQYWLFPIFTFKFLWFPLVKHTHT